MGLFDDEEEEDELENEEFSDDDVILANLGIKPKRLDGFRSKYPNKKVIYQDTITNSALEWYLETCSQPELEGIKIRKLTDTQQKMIMKKSEEGTTQIGPEKNTVADYINRNQELIREKDELFEKVQQLQEERDKLLEKMDALKNKTKKVINSIEVMEFNQQTFEMLKWVYNLLTSDKMEFKEDLTDEEIDYIKQIEGVIEE